MDIARVGSEYLAATDRINTKLDTLRKELTAMREQDLRLLKQLIHISETIRRLSSSQSYRGSRSLSCTAKSLQMTNGYFTVPSRKPPLVRQQSEPQYCQEEKYLSRHSSTSSADTLGSQEDMMMSSGSELDDSTSSLRLLKQRFRPRSFSFISCVSFFTDELKGGDSSYDEILKRNIKLWKWGQSQERESVFEEETSVIIEAEAER